MPEAFAVLAVVVVAIAAWIGAWMQARNPANHDSRQEQVRLQHHYAWLQERLEVARRENWGGEMVGGLADELEATARQLEGTNALPPPSQVARAAAGERP